MARAARRYDIYLPVTDNASRPFPDEQFRAVERRLLDRFGGFTTQQREFPLRGVWQAKPKVFVDQVIVITVLDFRPRGSARFIARLKTDLTREFDQLEILITESPLRVH